MSKFIYIIYIHPPRTTLTLQEYKCSIKTTFSLHRKSCKQTCYEYKAGPQVKGQGLLEESEEEILHIPALHMSSHPLSPTPLLHPPLPPSFTSSSSSFSSPPPPHPPASYLSSRRQMSWWPRESWTELQRRCAGTTAFVLVSLNWGSCSQHPWYSPQEADRPQEFILEQLVINPPP